jgi:alpha-tubulin suppressor-like RCC1 family protein
MSREEKKKSTSDALLSPGVASFGCGRNHSFVVTNDRKLYLFGDTSRAQLAQKKPAEVGTLRAFRDWEVLIPIDRE